jgi:hypothetical protein
VASRQLSDVTDPAAIIAAVSECDALGGDAFLAKYGFGRARIYELALDGRHTHRRRSSASRTPSSIAMRHLSRRRSIRRRTDRSRPASQTRLHGCRSGGGPLARLLREGVQF